MLAHRLCGYLTLAILVARATSEQRSEAALSYRFYGRGAQLFYTKFDAEAFESAVLNKLRDDRLIWLVRADIKDFYASIERTRLRQVLRQQGVERWCIDVLLEMLGCWEPSIGRGIPIGPAASHILAETFLIDVDKSLANHGIDHVRFVDDYRLFAPDLETAKSWIKTLGVQLGPNGLQLRPDKTSVAAVSKSAYEKALRQRNLPQFSALAVVDQTPEASPPPAPCPPSGCQRPRRPPPRSDIDHLMRVDTERLFSRLQGSSRTDLAVFRLFIEASHCRGELDHVQSATDLLFEAPHCVPYFVDFLMQEALTLSTATRAWISVQMGKLLNSDAKRLSDLEVIKTAILLGCEYYRYPQALAAYLQKMPSTQSPIAVRYLIEALGPDISPETASLVGTRLEVGSSWEQRAVMRIKSAHLSHYQSRIAIRAEQRRLPDPFLRALISDALPAMAH